MRPHIALHPYQRLDLRVQAVAHELEFAVWRNETDRPVILEPRQSHTLVELDVLHLYRLAPCRTSRRFKHHLVVQP